MTTKERLDTLEKELQSLREEAIFDTLRVRSLLLDDESGITRISLNADEDYPQLTLYDVEGIPRAVLYVDDGGPRLSLYDEVGTPRVSLGVDEDGPRLTLYDDEGKMDSELSLDWVDEEDEDEDADLDGDVIEDGDEILTEMAVDLALADDERARNRKVVDCET